MTRVDLIEGAGLMPEGFVVRINRRDALLEVAGPDGEWVDAKLQELAFVYKEAPSAGDRPLEESPSSQRRSKKTIKKKTTMTPETPSARKKSTGRGTGRTQKNADLDALLTREVKKQVADFTKARSNVWDKEGQPAKLAITATFLQDSLSVQNFDESDFYTVFSAMGWRSPSNWTSAINNARYRNNYFGSPVDGKFPLTHKGENYGRLDSLNP